MISIDSISTGLKYSTLYVLSYDEYKIDIQTIEM